MLQGIPLLMATSTKVVKYLLTEYTGATVAFSLRKLKADYTGNAIKVRRSSDNAEQNIGFTTDGNLDEASLTSFVGANDGFLVTWYDQSGNANDATQSTAANQPKIVNAGTIYRINNRPTVKFDGGDTMSLTSSVSGSSEYTISYVEQKAASTDNVIPMGSSTGFPVLTEHRGDGYVYIGYVGAYAYHQYIVSGVRLITGYTDMSTTYSAWGNSVALPAFGSVPGDVSSSLNRIGSNGGNFTTGDLSEIIFYLSNKTSDRTGIESNINGYYQIY